MTEQLKELIGSIKARLNAAGFTEIDSASNSSEQAEFVNLGEFPAPSKENGYSVFKRGKTIRLQVCGTHNDRLEPTSVYLAALTWDNSSTVRDRCFETKISWKFSAKKRSKLISDVLDFYKNN